MDTDHSRCLSQDYDRLERSLDYEIISEESELDRVSLRLEVGEVGDEGALRRLHFLGKRIDQCLKKFESLKNR